MRILRENTDSIVIRSLYLDCLRLELSVDSV